jgi:hypothetical protein
MRLSGRPDIVRFARFVVVRPRVVGAGFGAGGRVRIAGLADCGSEGSAGHPPRRLADQARHALEGEAQDGLVRAGARQVQHDPGLQRDNASGELDHAQPERVELRDAPGGALRHEAAERPKQQVSSGVQHQAKLVGGGAAT